MEEGQAKNRNEAPLVTDGAAVSGDTAVQNEPVFKDGKKKMSGGVIACIIILAVLAIGGIGFGVWAILNGNSKTDELKQEIALLVQQNNELSEKLSKLEGASEQEDEKNEADAEDDYFYLDELGIKVKKSDAFPEMVVENIDDNDIYANYFDSGFIIKRSSDVADNASAPDLVHWMKVNTCNPAELTLGYSKLINIADTCYIMGEIYPIGSDPEYPMTDFLTYVMDENNYESI